MLRRSASVMCVQERACPWRAGQKAKGPHWFLSDLSGFLLTCCVPCTPKWGRENPSSRWPFKCNFIDTVLTTFALASTNLSLLSRNKGATSCCYTLPILDVIKRGTIKNGFRKKKLIWLPHTIGKMEECIMNLSFWFLSPFHGKLKERDKDGAKGSHFSVVLPKASSLSFSKRHTSWSFENHYNYHKAALSLGRKWVSFPLGDRG